MPGKKGLYANIHAKRERIAAGSGEKMKKPGAKEHLQHLILKKQLRQLRKRNDYTYGRGKILCL